MAPINRDDKRASSFSSYDSGYTVHNLAFLDTTTYEQDGDKLASTIDLNGQTLTATQPLTDLGAEVR